MYSNCIQFYRFLIEITFVIQTLFPVDRRDNKHFNFNSVIGLCHEALDCQLQASSQVLTLCASEDKNPQFHHRKIRKFFPQNTQFTITIDGVVCQKNTSWPFIQCKQIYHQILLNFDFIWLKQLFYHVLGILNNKKPE